MDIKTGDYVTLKSVEEVKPLYKFWDVTSSGSVITDTDYFSTNMLEVMGSDNKYRVLEANQDGVWVDIKGKMWGFDEMCIKDVYRLTNKTMYVVKDDVGTIIAVFDTEKKANKFVKKNKNYYVDDEVKYGYKDFYYKEVQGTTVRVYATRFDVTVEVMENTTTTHHNMQVRDDIKNGIFDFTFCVDTFSLENALVYIRVWFMEHRLDSIVEMPWKVSE